MIDTSDNHLMMIEPVGPAQAMIHDELTALAMKAMLLAKPDPTTWCKGFHTCACGRHSDNRLWLFPNGVETNSLLLHYVAEHRDEVPDSELDKLKAIVKP